MDQYRVATLCFIGSALSIRNWSRKKYEKTNGMRENKRKLVIFGRSKVGDRLTNPKVFKAKSPAE